MYKTTYELAVMSRSGGDPSLLEGAAAATALNQVKSCRDIDVIMSAPDNPILIAIVPYHSIDYVAVIPTRSEEEDPVDENLKNCSGGGDGGDTGTLTIINTGEQAIVGVEVLLANIEPGVYGGIEFESDEGDDLPPGITSLVTGIVPEIDAGSSVTITGIPTGTFYVVPNAAEGGEGTIPGTVVIHRAK